jgi:hypothetical protein
MLLLLLWGLLLSVPERVDGPSLGVVCSDDSKDLDKTLLLEILK